MADRRGAPRSASAGSSARRTRASSAARATTSTTSQLPGMLHGAVLRSPLAHARIVSIDTSRRARSTRRSTRSSPARTSRGWASPGCRRCRPTSQAVLATDKVRFQGQEVAFVVADDHYAARDALELIDVEYEPLPPVVDAAQGARRRTRPVDPRRHGGPDRQPHLRLGGRRPRRRPTRCSPTPTSSSTQDMLYPRVAPGADGDVRRRSPTCDPVDGKLTLWTHDAGAARAPHAVRARRRAARAQDPRDLAGHRRRLRQQGADLPRLRLLDRRLDRHRQAGQVDGGPLGEPHVDRLRPRLPHAAARSPRRATGKILGVRVDVLADHGAFNATAQPTKYPAGFFHIFTGSYDLEAAHCKVTGVYTNKAPGGVAYACSFRVTEAVYLVERMVDVLAARARTWTRPSCG